MPPPSGVPLNALSALSLDLPKYEILGEIGHGGMATVYRARDKRLGREVAIKVIHRHLRENVEVARRFAGEALAVAKVKHPNIVEVYDVSGEDEAERYLVVELIEGCTLRKLLAEHGPLPAEVAAAIALEVTRALCQAHRQGVVHRDVKPENVLLRIDAGHEADEGPEMARVKLTDFGIAKLLDAQGVTCTGQVLGSPAHMAPEQIEGGDVDARSDVFGVGVLFYEMLTGTLPFEGKNPAQVLRRVLEGTFVPAERARPEVGNVYGRIVAEALAHRPDDRFATAGLFGEALEAELARVGVTNVRAEISRYLRDPAAYAIEHAKTIPDRLAVTASEARKSGNVVLSAGDFNRALAYRPDDTMLLAEVAGLSRRSRRKKRLYRMAGIALGGLLVASAVAGATWLVGRFRADVSPSKQPEKVAGAPATKPSTQTVEEAPSVPEGPMVVPATPKGPRRSPALAKPERPEVPGVRAVRTPVVGPQNSLVRIDGKLQPWFATHELTLGPHTFEFVPPNTECCEPSPPETVEVVEGAGPQLVRGVIRFRPATIRLSAGPGARASCGVGGVIQPDESRPIPMGTPERKLSCTIFPPPGDDAGPKRIDVDLRPGRTFTLTGP